MNIPNSLGNKKAFYFIAAMLLCSLYIFFYWGHSCEESIIGGGVWARVQLFQLNTFNGLWEHRWVRYVVYIGCGYLLWCILALICLDWVLFPSGLIPKVEFKSPEDKVLVQIKTETGETVEAWYLPPFHPNPPYPAVMFFHGNGELIDFWPEELREYRRLGIGVMLPEYRGYGRSGGKPGQKAIGQDMKKFREWLEKKEEIDSSKIFYHGRSLGGGVACDLASSFPPAALILQSTFISISKMAQRYLILPFFIRHPFDNAKVLSKIKCPVLIIHGNRDGIVPVTHGRYLHKIASQSIYYEIEGVGHNDLPMGKDFWEKITRFLENAGILKRDHNMDSKNGSQHGF